MNKLITGLHNRLMEAIDADLGAFLAERPFLSGGEQVILSPVKSIQTNMEVKEIAKVLKQAVDDSIPPTPEPVQDALPHFGS